jgi:O-antigen/teichoic acid export membrane protein
LNRSLLTWRFAPRRPEVQAPGELSRPVPAQRTGGRSPVRELTRSLAGSDLLPAHRESLWAWARRQAGAPYVQLMICQLCTAGTATVANILMARALAPSGRGVVALLLQVTYLSSQILLLGSERSFVAGYHGSSPAAAVRAYARLIARPCAAALALAALAALILPAHLRPARTVLALIAAYTVVNVVVQAVRALAIATNRYTSYLVTTVVTQFLILATLTSLLAGGVTDPSVWFLGYALSYALPTLACVLRWWRQGAPDEGPAEPIAMRNSQGAWTSGRRKTDQIRTVRREGLALLPAAVANMGMLRFDRLMLPALASTAALGLYATVATMTELVSWPLQAYADSRLGVWRAADRKRRLRISPLLVRAVGYTVIVGPVLGVVTYLLIVPLFGERYASATRLVLPLVAAASLYAISRVTLSLLIARGRNLLASAVEVAGFVASLVGYLVLIPTHGALGAAYGSLIGYGTCLFFALAALWAPIPLTRAAQAQPEGSGG